MKNCSDVRKNKIYLFVEKIINFFNKLKWHLFEKKRLKKINKSNLGNNYDSFQEDKYIDDLIKYNEPYERRLFLALCLTNAIRFKNMVDILDVGGGVGIQAEYLLDNFNNRINKIDIVEQKNLVRFINNYRQNNNINKKIFYSNNMNLYQEKYDLIFFNGSISYLYNPIQILKDIKCNTIVCISRLTVSVNDDKPFIIFDKFGGHEENILPELLIKNFLSQKEVFFYEKQNLIPSKSLVDGSKLISINFSYKS